MKRVNYIVYDGRAAFSTEDATILEAFSLENDQDHDGLAMKEARQSWKKQGAFLYKYTLKNDILIEETMVGFIDDYDSFPR